MAKKEEIKEEIKPAMTKEEMILRKIAAEKK
jgi:hypothetical protein